MFFEKVIVTTDFSPESCSTFEIARRQAREGTQIILLSVIEDWEIPEILLRQIPDPVSVEKYRKGMEKSAEERMQQLVDAHFSGLSVQARVVFSTDSVADEICTTAKTEKADLILIGSHGRRAFQEFIMGSVTKKVIARSPCPVLVIPPRQQSASQ